MKHTLDNPAYHALITGNRDLSHGTEDVKYFSKTVSPFVGLKENSLLNLETLAEILPGNDRRAVVHPGPLEVPPCWNIFQEVPVLQMVCSSVMEAPTDEVEIRVLGTPDVPAMMALTKLSRPGPFDAKTLLFGHYRGLFIDGRLTAMAGQRMHPVPYAEISAVCTHPDYRGQGLAGRLILDQIRRIRESSEVPFLHVAAENTSAIRLYGHLGFVVRKALKVFILEKAPARPPGAPLPSVSR